MPQQRQTRRDSHKSSSSASIRSARSAGQRLSSLVRSPPPVEEPPVRHIDDVPSALGGVVRLLSISSSNKTQARRYPPSAPSNARARDLHHAEPAPDSATPSSSGSGRSFNPLQLFRSASIKSQRSVHEHESPTLDRSVEVPSPARRRSTSPARPPSSRRKRSFDAASMLMLRKRSSDPNSTPETQLPPSWTERKHEAKTILRTASPRLSGATSGGAKGVVSFSPATAHRSESRTLEEALREGSWSSDWSPTVLEPPAELRSPAGAKSVAGVLLNRSPARSLPRSPNTSRLARPATSDGSFSPRSPLERGAAAHFSTLPGRARSGAPLGAQADTASLWTQSSARSITSGRSMAGSHVASPARSQTTGWTAEPDPLYIGPRMPRPTLLQVVQDGLDDSPSVVGSTRSRNPSTNGSARESIDSKPEDVPQPVRLQHSTSVSERLNSLVSSAASAIGLSPRKSAGTPSAPTGEHQAQASSSTSLRSPQRSPSKPAEREAMAPPRPSTRRPRTAPHDAGSKPFAYIPNHLTREDVNTYIDVGLRSPLLAALSTASLSMRTMSVDLPLSAVSGEMPYSARSDASSVDPRDTSRLSVSAASRDGRSRLSAASTSCASSRTGDMFLSANTEDGEFAQPGPFRRPSEEDDRAAGVNAEVDGADEVAMTPRAREVPLLDLSTDSMMLDQSYDVPETSQDSAALPSPVKQVPAVQTAAAPAPSPPSTPISPATVKSSGTDGETRARGASLSSSRMLIASRQRIETILSAGPQQLRGFKARRPQEAPTSPKRTTRQRLLSLFRGSSSSAPLQPLPARAPPARRLSQLKQPAATSSLSRQVSNGSTVSSEALTDSTTQVIASTDVPPPVPDKSHDALSPSDDLEVSVDAATEQLAEDVGHRRQASGSAPLERLSQEQLRRLARSSLLLSTYLDDEDEDARSSSQALGSSGEDWSAPDAPSSSHHLKPPSPPPNLQLNLPLSSPLRFTFDGDELRVLDEDEQASKDSSAVREDKRPGSPSLTSYETAPPSSPTRVSPPRSNSRAGARTPDGRRASRLSTRSSGVARVRKAAYFRGSKPPLPPRHNAGSAHIARAPAPVDAHDSSSSSSFSDDPEEEDGPSMPGSLRAPSPRFSRREKVRVELQRKVRNRARVDALHSLEGTGKQRNSDGETASSAAQSDDEAAWDSESSALAFNTELLLKVQSALPTLLPGTSDAHSIEAVSETLAAPAKGGAADPFVTPKPPRKLVVPPEDARLEHEQRGLRDLEDAERSREYARSLHVDQPTPGRFGADAGVAP